MAFADRYSSGGRKKTGREARWTSDHFLNKAPKKTFLGKREKKAGLVSEKVNEAFRKKEENLVTMNALISQAPML